MDDREQAEQQAEQKPEQEVERVGEYEVTVDPMDRLQCDGCQ